MLTIGFTNVYYTLWNVNSFMKSKLERGEIKWYLCTEYQYLRNLSTDLEKAKEKVMSLGPNTQYNVDLALHGTKWFMEEKEFHMPGEARDYTFTFGRYKGCDIRTIGLYEPSKKLLVSVDKAITLSPALSVNIHVYIDFKFDLRDERDRWSSHKRYLKDVVWQLNRAMLMESTARRKAYARRRLIELGELVRRDWMEKIPIATGDNPDAPMQYQEVKRKWMPKALAKWHDDIGSKKGLFYTDKKRVNLTIREVKSKMVPSQFGTMYIINYVDSEGQIVTYKGGTPLFGARKGEPFEGTVAATIKHKRNETFIQRIKLVQ